MKVILTFVLSTVLSLMLAATVGTVSGETIKELFSTVNDIFDY